MKKILVGAAAFGCIRGPSWAGKTEIPAKRSSARYEPSWPVIPVMIARFISEISRRSQSENTGAAHAFQRIARVDDQRCLADDRLVVETLVVCRDERAVEATNKSLIFWD